MLRILFGARAQVAVGALLFALTLGQWIWWTWIHKPSVNAVFQVSMEALAFTAYAIVATGLGYRATERVEKHVNVDVGTDD